LAVGYLIHQVPFMLVYVEPALLRLSVSLSASPILPRAPIGGGYPLPPSGVVAPRSALRAAFSNNLFSLGNLHPEEELILAQTTGECVCLSTERTINPQEIIFYKMHVMPLVFRRN